MELNRLLFPGEYDGGPFEGIDVSRIVNDGRKITPGSLFICHEGKNYNSHVLLPQLKEAGCVAAVAARAYAEIDVGVPLLKIADTRRAEAFIASRFSGDPGKRLILIGVTGTNGKTSVATMIRHILNEAGIRAAMIGTTGYVGDTGNENAFARFHAGEAATMTTPPPLTLYPLLAAMSDAGITHVVMEVSSQALDQARVAPLSFACSVFTNLSPEHLDYHRDMNAYLQAKKILFQQTECAVVNGDTPWTDLLLEGLSCRRVNCGSVGDRDLQATDIRFDGSEGVSFVLQTEDGRFPVSIPIPGAFTVQNALLAIAAAREVGVDLCAAVGALPRLPTVPGRMEKIDTGDLPFSVLIDYAHTEAALRSLLLSVRGFRRPGERIVLLFGCGGDRDPAKRAAMGRTAAELADYTLVTSDNSRSEDPKKIIREILSGMPDHTRRRVIVDREKAIRYAIGSAQPGDIVLLVGKGHETYEIGRDGIKAFDEKKIVREALKERRNGHTTEDGNADRNGISD